MKLSNIFKNGLIKENPVLVQLVGLCPVLAVTTTAFSGLSMGLAVTAVLLGSNIVVSLLRNVIPNKIRIPAFIVIIATFVTLLQMFLNAFVQPVYQALGIFLPLIVVNCTILARAEAFASKNRLIPSMVDAVGVGLGFTLVVTVLGATRELLGNGTVLGGTDAVVNLFGDAFQAIGVFVAPAGAFILLGIFLGIFNVASKRKKA